MTDDIGRELTELTSEVNAADLTDRAYRGARKLGIQRVVLGAAVAVALLGGGVAGAVTIWPGDTGRNGPADGDCASQEPSPSGSDDPTSDEPSPSDGGSASEDPSPSGSDDPTSDEPSPSDGGSASENPSPSGSDSPSSDSTNENLDPTVTFEADEPSTFTIEVEPSESDSPTCEPSEDPSGSQSPGEEPSQSPSSPEDPSASQSPSDEPSSPTSSGPTD